MRQRRTGAPKMGRSRKTVCRSGKEEGENRTGALMTSRRKKEEAWCRLWRRSRRKKT